MPMVKAQIKNGDLEGGDFVRKFRWNMGCTLDTGGAIDYIGSDSSMSGYITCQGDKRCSSLIRSPFI
jgi:hypothetical protein